MNRLTLGLLDTPVARILNVCPGDERVAEYCNRVERRLVARGKWVGTTARYRICTSSTGCLTWPRAIETIEAFQVCNVPGVIRNGWYEFSQQGPGLLNADSSWWNNLVDRGTACTFDVPDNATSIVGVSGELGVTEAADAKLLIRGYEDSTWVRSEYPVGSGTQIDGEYVRIEGGITHYTTHRFTAITSVVKPVTNGPVTLWQFDVPTNTAVKQLAYYEADEQVPIYRCSLLPGMRTRRGCPPQTNCGCRDTERTQVTVMAKLRHIDARLPNDLFLLGSEGAFTLGVQALLKEERNLPTEAIAYWNLALAELQAELSSYEGDGAIPTFKYEGSSSWGAGVQNAVTLGWPITW